MSIRWRGAMTTQTIGLPLSRQPTVKRELLSLVRPLGQSARGSRLGSFGRIGVAEHLGRSGSRLGRGVLIVLGTHELSPGWRAHLSTC